MQTTANTLQILVGENKTPITLTDSAVVAVQGEASGLVELHMGTILGIWQDTPDGAEWNAESLLSMRDALQLCMESVDVLIECRPLEEFGGSPDA